MLMYHEIQTDNFKAKLYSIRLICGKIKVEYKCHNYHESKST